MTVYYVDPTAVGLANGLTKADAFITLAAAFAVATGEGDEIRCAHDRMEVLGADTTYTIAANKLSVVSWDFANDVKKIGFSVGHQSLNRSITFTLAATPASNLRVLRIYGIAFIISGSTADSFNLFTAVSGVTVFWESSSFVMQNSATTCRTNIGGSGEFQGIQFFSGCYFSRAKAAQVIVLGDHQLKFINCQFNHIIDTVVGPLFIGVEQGPDTILEDCYVYGRYDDLIRGAVSGTRAIRMIRGLYATNTWPEPTFDVGETGLWGYEREFVDVTISNWSTGETAKYSSLYGPGRFYEFTLPLNPDSSTITKPAGIYISGEIASSDYAVFSRPVATLQAKQEADSLPDFWRVYILHQMPEFFGADNICVTASLAYEGANAIRNVRAFAYNLFEPDLYSPTLVEDLTPPAPIQDIMNYLEVTEAHYFDIPKTWLTRGIGIVALNSFSSWEFTAKIHLRNRFDTYLAPYLFPNGEIPSGIHIDMQGGYAVQTVKSGGGAIPDPIPGYKALVLLGGTLAQVDVTLNEPPTGVPAVWTGNILRTLAPGESVVLQNP